MSGQEIDSVSGEDVTLELDADLIAWFTEKEDNREIAINAASREHVARQRRAS